MNQKLRLGTHIFLFIIGIFLVDLAVWQGGFFGTEIRVGAFTKPESQKFSVVNHNPEVLAGHAELGHAFLSIDSSYSLHVSDISADCEVHKEYITRTTDSSVYTLFVRVFPGNNCDGKVTLSFPSEKEGDEYSFAFDYQDHDRWLSQLMDTASEPLEQRKEKLSYWLAFDEQKRFRGEDASENTRKYIEMFLTYEFETLSEILEMRENPRYKIPVIGAELPTDHSYLPNSGRPYRSQYTDGIHHGWDFYADLGTPVIAASKGLVVFVKKDFDWSEFQNIRQPSENPDYIHTNLHTLRGNQVWLKTMSGDVLIYSHLEGIPTDLRVGDMVHAGDTLGVVGVTGVPAKAYSDYHLHIPLMVNPLDQDKVGNYSLLDIMKWDWYGRNNSFEWILEQQQTLFSA